MAHMTHAITYTADAGTKGFAGRTLPPFLAIIQRTIDEANQRALQASIRDWEEKWTDREAHRQAWADAGVENMLYAKDWADRRRMAQHG